jgi:hypothetical protein
MIRKKPLAIGAGVLALLVLLGIALSPPKGPVPGPKGPGTRPSFEVGIPTAQEVRNMLAVYGERVDGAERELSALRAQLLETQKKIEESRQKEASTLEKILRDLQSATKTEPAPPPSSAPRFKTFEFEKGKGSSLHLPAGSFGEATLLTGVYAPTTGEALPVLFRLDAALIGPQRTRVPLRGAFLVGKAQGEANSRRAVVQLETLSAVRPDGQPSEVRVNGWAVDDDGIQGLRGVYVWHADEILALSTLTGGLAGGAEAMSQKETTAQITPLGGVQGTVTGDPLKFAGYRAVSSALGRLSDIVSARLHEIVPAIYVANARRVTVAFISGATLEGYEAPVAAASPFEGLDR